ncbi:MAG: hypothetical protein PHQ28_02495 [Mycobacterium sp.]|nr:hypothetical protein [Mycobacterium sp.]
MDLADFSDAPGAGPDAGPLWNGVGGSDADSAADAAEAANLQQARYFLALLGQRRRLLDRRIDEYRRALSGAEAGGDRERARGLRRLAHIEEQDRKTLDGLIDNLRRRFPPERLATR